MENLGYVILFFAGYGAASAFFDVLDWVLK